MEKETIVMEQSSYTSSPYPNPQPPPIMPLPQTVHTVLTRMVFSKESQHIICPHCHADISTRVVSEANTKTHLLALLLCACGCCCCAPCPYCTDSSRVHRHYCPACTNFLGESTN
ncbi:uncharacterized protein LOC143898254 [Temnothorax americanus]|uniref:uncharacterized protein LOC143898254 n=1 Tax=Temnothorax americanus TaxID=1964332 RepID=UPI0040682B15